METETRVTPRETDVLRLLSRGCSYAEIGRRMGISAHTVTSHVKNCYRKLDVHSGAAAVMRAVELGVLGPGSQGGAELASLTRE